MFKLVEQFKPIMLCFSIITFFLIGYAVSGGLLHEAAKTGDLAELLISKGAIVNSVDKNGRTPLDLANYSHHKDLAELLIKHGGETRSPWSGAASGRLL